MKSSRIEVCNKKEQWYSAAHFWILAHNGLRFSSPGRGALDADAVQRDKVAPARENFEFHERRVAELHIFALDLHVAVILAQLYDKFAIITRLVRQFPASANHNVNSVQLRSMGK